MLTTMGDAGCPPGTYVGVNGQCSDSGGLFDHLAAFMTNDPRVRAALGLSPTPGGGPATGPAMATTVPMGAPSAGSKRWILWLAIGGVAVTAGVLLLKRR